MDLVRDLEALAEGARQSIASAPDDRALEDLRVRYLGKKGEISAVLRGMGQLAPEARPRVGEVANRVRDEVEALLVQARQRIEDARLEQELQGSRIDVTLPGRRLLPRGHRHPVTRTTEEIVAIFARLGYEVGDFNQAFFAGMAEAGADVIRIPVHPESWVRDPDYLWRYLDPVVAWAGESGQYVIIDWHFIGNVATGAGPQMPDLEAAPLDLTLDFWRQTAGHFRDAPNVIFEIFNEPQSIGADEWQDSSTEIVQAICAEGTDQLVIVGGIDYGRDLSWVPGNPVEDGNTAYASHIYPAHPASGWGHWFGETAAQYPVLVTEWGFMDDNGDPAQSYLAGSQAGGRFAVVTDLFGGLDPVGKQIKINNILFEVIGVMKSQGSGGFGFSRDTTTYVPITTAFARLSNARIGAQKTVGTIEVSAADSNSINTAIAAISDRLRTLHKIKPGATDDFTAQSQADILATATQVTSILTVFLGAIAGISLIVGGIGIMNIMLVSVTERTREIGLRKAVGARRSDILYQFLVETVTLSVLGGIIGILVGAGLSALVNASGAIATAITSSTGVWVLVPATSALLNAKPSTAAFANDGTATPLRTSRAAVLPTASPRRTVRDASGRTCAAMMSRAAL